MNSVMKAMLVILLLIYVISPVDLCPGPVDDIILILCAMGGRTIKSKEDSEGEKNENQHSKQVR